MNSIEASRYDDGRSTLAPWERHFYEHPDSPDGQMWGQVRFELAAAERDTATIETLGRHIVPPLLEGRADEITFGNGTQFVCPALAVLGRRDEAIRILLRGVEMGVTPPYDFLLLEPGFQPLRNDSRFAKVVTASRDGAAKIARLLQQARGRGELPKYLGQPLDDFVKLLAAHGTTP